MTKAKLANISCSECHKLTDKRKILFKLPKKTTNYIGIIPIFNLSCQYLKRNRFKNEVWGIL